MALPLLAAAAGWVVDWTAVGAVLPPKCSAPHHDGLIGEVHNLSLPNPNSTEADERCFVTLYADQPKASPMPVLLWHHGAGGNAGDCGKDRTVAGEALGNVVKRHGFTLVCTEAM